MGKGLAATELGLGPWVWMLIPGLLCPHWGVSRAHCLQMGCWAKSAFLFEVVYVAGGGRAIGLLLGAPSMDETEGKQ